MMNERMLGATRIRLSRRGFATLARASVMTLALFGSGCGDPIEVTPQTEAMAAPRKRVYYIAADEVQWDYAPTGSNQVTGEPFDDAANVFVQQGDDRIGKVYIKALYREYTDGR